MGRVAGKVGLVSCLALWALAPRDGTALAGPAPDFVKDVRPILERSCLGCHGPERQKGGYRLDVRDVALKGGDRGEPAIVPHAAKASPLILAVSGEDQGLRMPPKGSGKPRLTAAEVETLRAWIDAGPAWPEAYAGEKDTEKPHWSLTPLARPAVPGGAANPIDAFVRAKLGEHKLAPTPEADRRTLIRRLSYGLTGLPPTPEEVGAFVAGGDAKAYEALVDRWLASPRYGEHWARHWLDVAHYADTHGNDHDHARPNAWPYRDYVIRSLNDDKPYGRFVREQVAGDALFPDDPQATVALGFLAAGPWDETLMVGVREDTYDHRLARVLDRDDMVTTVMSTFQGLTVHCARCHDHKFDPITQREYYALQAVFAGVDRADRPVEADAATLARRRELVARRAALAGREAGVMAWLDSPEAQQQAAAFAEGLNSADRRAAWPATVEGLLQAPEDRRTPDDRRELTLQVLAAEVVRDLAALPAPRMVYAATHDFPPTGSFKPAAVPRPIHLLTRGDLNTPAEVVGPGALSCVPGLDSTLEIGDETDESARRAALARWLGDDRNGLTWRNIVNRVWHYHFGRGLCDTPNDFGKMGGTPSHPELLDWLAVWFRDEAKGSLKALHRLILTSETYRQAAAHRADAAALDANNRLLWRRNRTRLAAEQVRDGLLQTSGQLDLAMGGPAAVQFVSRGPATFMPAGGGPAFLDYENFPPDSPENRRRAVYRFLFRTVADPFMDALDAPDGGALAPVRGQSTTALQAFALLNDAFVIRQCEHIATRLERDAKGGDPVAGAFRLLLQREPNAGELARFAAYAREHGLANTCHVLVNSNEFLYLD